MTRDEIVAEIKRGLGYRSDKTDEIITKLYLAQLELERGKTLPWFIVTEDETITLAPDESEWPLPSTFIREVEDLGYPYASLLTLDGQVIHVRKVPYDLAYSKYAGTSSSSPVVYGLRKNTMVFFPTPTETTTLLLSYYTHQADLRLEASNAWTENAPELLIGLAGMMIAGDLEHSSAQQKFATMYGLAKQSVFYEIVAREESNTVQALGGGL